MNSFRVFLVQVMHSSKFIESRQQVKPMKSVISFARNATLHNILFDEYFAEYHSIAVLAFNYDGAGTALCRCDGTIAEIEKSNLRTIIFGVDKTVLEAYLTSIFDPEMENEGIHRQNGAPFFRLPELQNMKKYDVANLAKKTLKEVQAQAANTFHYFSKTDEAPVDSERHQNR